MNASIYQDRSMWINVLQHGKRLYARYRVPLVKSPLGAYSADRNHRYMIYVYNPAYPKAVFTPAQSIARKEVYHATRLEVQA